MMDFFLRWWLHNGRYAWSRLRRWLCEGKYLKITLPSVNSLEEIEACLKQVEWTLDGPLHLWDSISYPETVWAKKKDDCDGFASLAAELLFRWNPDYKPVLVTAIVRPVSLSHTVCAFNNLEGDVWFFDNDSLRRESYDSYNDVVAAISEDAKRLVCWDVRNPRSFEIVEYHRS
jgi:hypothetical protein